MNAMHLLGFHQMRISGCSYSSSKRHLREEETKGNKEIALRRQRQQLDSKRVDTVWSLIVVVSFL